MNFLYKDDRTAKKQIEAKSVKEIDGAQVRYFKRFFTSYRTRLKYFRTFLI